MVAVLGTPSMKGQGSASRRDGTHDITTFESAVFAGVQLHGHCEHTVYVAVFIDASHAPKLCC